MDINWLSILLHFVAARLRWPARAVLLIAVWLARVGLGGSEAAPGRDESASMRHAVVEVTVTRHWSGKVEVIVERAVETTVEKTMERMAAIVVTRI